jgi:hypothetical protein
LVAQRLSVGPPPTQPGASGLWTGEYHAYGASSSEESDFDDDDEDEGDEEGGGEGGEKEEGSEELRYDADGSVHSARAFADYYGPDEGARAWAAATVARPAKAAAEHLPRESRRRRRRRDSKRRAPVEPPWARFAELQRRTTGSAPTDGSDSRVAAAFAAFLLAEAEANALEAEQEEAHAAARAQTLQTRRVKSPVRGKGHACYDF